MSSYVVRRAPPRMVLLRPLLTAAFLVTVTLVLEPPRLMAAIFGVGVVVITALQARAVVTVLRVDHKGIALSAAHSDVPAVRVPWASVRALVVVTGQDGKAQVGVRLHPGAPLPTGVRGMIRDPADPDRVQPSLVREIPGLDRAALAAAAEPRGVRVVTANAM